MTLGDVAREVGLAKSNVLRYFETREEIYGQLTAEGWRDRAEAVHTRLDGASAGPAEVAHALTQTLSERPLFCDLLAHTPANLEHNVSPRTFRALKLNAQKPSASSPRLSPVPYRRWANGEALTSSS